MGNRAQLQREVSKPGPQALSAMWSIWSHLERNGQIQKDLKKEMTWLISVLKREFRFRCEGKRSCVRRTIQGGRGELDEYR